MLTGKVGMTKLMEVIDHTLISYSLQRYVQSCKEKIMTNS